jgi:hypothetical protein
MADNRFNLFFQLTKVDVQKREVWGRATQEVPDKVREVMDYKSSVPLFRKWSEEAQRRTAILGKDAQSLGNVREMHEPIAAGKVIAMEFNDAEKAIDIGTVCVDDNSWNKILKGVLTGFSVGGSYAKRWPDVYNPSLMRYTADPNEVSYVDSPAVPTATYKLIKADGMQELRKVGQPLALPMAEDQNPAGAIPFIGADANPSAPPVETVVAGQDVRDIPTVAGKYLSPDIIDPDRAIVPGVNVRNDPVEKAEEPAWAKTVVQAARELTDALSAVKAEKNQAEAVLKAIGSRVGIARRDGAPLSQPQDSPTSPDAYGDPANWSWLVDTPARAQSAIANFNRALGKTSYSDREWNVLGRRLAHRAGTLYGVKCQYNPKDKQITGIEARKMLQPFSKLDMGMLVSQMQQALNIAVDQIAKDPTAAKDMLLAVIGNLDDAAGSPASVSSSSNPTPPTGSQAGADNTALKAVTSAVTGTTTPLDGGPTTVSTIRTTPPPGTGATTPMINTPTGITSATDMTGKGTLPSSSSSSGSSTPSSLAAALPAPSASTPSLGISGGSPSSTPTDPVLKALDDKINTLTETVAKMLEAMTGGAAQPANKGVLPAGDLAQMVKRAEADQTNPVLAKLLSGDKHAFAKAAQAAGTDDHPNMEAVYDIAIAAAHESLASSGVFSQLYGRGGPMFVPPEINQQ